MVADYALGIDVGTTYSAAAVWRDDRVELVALASHEVTVPTVIFADAGEVLFGRMATRHGAARPDAMAREFKRRVGDSVPIILSGVPYAADRLMAMFVRWMVDTVTEQIGAEPTRIVMTHPANWTAFQLGLLSDALGEEGLGGVRFIAEPEAAAIDFAATAELEEGREVLVYDLGGGTFDVSLLRREAGGFATVGSPGGIPRLGGIDFDEAVVQYVMVRVPSDVLEQARSTTPGKLASAELRQRCIHAREELSGSATADVPVLLPGFSTTVRLTRAELESMILPALERTVEVLRRVIARSSADAESLSAVLLVGGTSRTPVVAELVGTALGLRVRVDAHPKLVVARGAARHAATLSTAAHAEPLPPGRSRGRAIALIVLAVLLGGVVATSLAIRRGGDDRAAGPATTSDASSPAERTGPSSASATSPAATTPLTVTAIDLIATASIPAGERVDGTLVGGLSGLAYDPGTGRFHAVSDDVSSPRVYTMTIDVEDGELADDDITVLGTTLLRRDAPSGTGAELDGEGIIVGEDGSMWVANEGNAESGIAPSLLEVDPTGLVVSETPSPDWYAPSTVSGIRGGGFAGLTRIPGTSDIVVAVESPLRQDEQAPGVEAVARLLVYPPTGGEPIAEFGYPLDPETAPNTPPTVSESGRVDRLMDLVALDDAGTVLVVERSRVGTLRCYEVQLIEGSTTEPSPRTPPPLAKRLVAELDAPFIQATTFQGVDVGPELSDGRRSIVLVADNNLLSDATSVIALAMTLAPR